MATQDSSSSEQKQQYMSKRVMINGQFVTLYSANGVTWLSSPEDIPDTMARLDNTRITLTEDKEGEKSDPQKDDKGDKGDKLEKGAKAEKAEKAATPPPKVQGSQYRMKGPKPRPILRQGGKTVKGTPIEPVSASSVNIKGPVDLAIPQVKLSPMEEGIRRGKLIAPIAQRRPGKPKVAPPPKKVAAQAGKGAPPVKGKVPAPPPAKVAKGVKLPEKATKVAAPVKGKGVASKARAVKAVKPAASSKKAVKPAKAAKKSAAKKPAHKKSAHKSSAKKRSR